MSNNSIPEYGERLPPEEEPENSQEEDVPQAPSGPQWNPKNRVTLEKVMTVKELKTLNPFREDEAYLAEKQVDRLRQNLREINLRDVMYVRLGNAAFSFSAFFIFFSLIFDNMERSVLTYTIGAVFLIIPYFTPYMFNASRVWEHSQKRLKVATRVAAFGEAYRSRYNLKLTHNDWKNMLRVGVVEALDVDDNSYRVITDMDLSADNYVIIRRTD